MDKNGVQTSQGFSHRVTAGGRGDGPGLVYRYEPTLPKPAVHPLITPSGVTISGFEMSDHVWHRGLWFTIKFINESNFWEEHPPFGVQVGQAEPTTQLLHDGSVLVRHDLQWSSEATGPVLWETRTMRYVNDGALPFLDWQSQLRAASDVTLDRTPFTTWGGYGGLAFRGSRELHDVRFHLPEGEPVAALSGQAHPWCFLTARVDGGIDRHISLGMIDHPDNTRSPTPWYCKSGNGFTYMNPAFLFNEPMSIRKNQRLTLRYRIAWCDGLLDRDAFLRLVQAFRESEAPTA